MTDMGLPDNHHPVSLEDILKAANGTEPMMTELIANVIERMKI